MKRRRQRHGRLDLLLLHRRVLVLVAHQLQRQHRGEADQLRHGDRVLLLAAVLAVVLLVRRFFYDTLCTYVRRNIRRDSTTNNANLL